MKKNLVVLTTGYDKIVLGKDNFLIPYHYGEMNDMDVEIVYPYKEEYDLPDTHRGVKFTPVFFKTNYNPFSFWGEWYFCWYIFLNAPKIDVLMHWYFSYNTFLIGWIYKWRNPKGRFFIKGDDYCLFKSLFRKNRKWRNEVIRRILKKECSLADIVTVDTTQLYNELKNGQFGFKLGDKLKQVINAFDEETLQKLNIVERSFEEKDNLFITVGRLGTWQKNTELLLDAFKNVEFRDWKLVLIGAIDASFEQYVQDYFKKYPRLKDRIFFTGVIYDKKELWEWYNRAKVFVLTSRQEGYAVVYTEAIRFSNYILTTEVGGAIDSLNIGCGELFEQENADMLKSKLQSIINGEIFIEKILKEKKVSPSNISWEAEILKL